MKKNVLLMVFGIILSTHCFAESNIIQCSGVGYSIELDVERKIMSIKGNKLDVSLANVYVKSSFQVLAMGNSQKLGSTFKLNFKDSETHLNNGSLMVSSATGVKNIEGLNCKYAE